MSERPSPPLLPPLQWAAPEIAWPLALVSGFGGTWAGIELGFPGVAALLAAGTFAPLWIALLVRGRRLLAVLLSLGWAIGIYAAAIGCAFADRWASVSIALPGSGTWVGYVLQPWIAASREGAWTAAPLAWAATAGALALVAGAARLGQGLPAVLLLAVLLGAAGGGVARVAERAVDQGWDPLLAAMLAWPPHTGLQVLGALLVCTALAEPGPLLPLRWLPPERRALLLGGLVAAAVGLASELLFATTWIRWLGHRIDLRGILGP